MTAIATTAGESSSHCDVPADFADRLVDGNLKSCVGGPIEAGHTAAEIHGLWMPLQTVFATRT